MPHILETLATLLAVWGCAHLPTFAAQRLAKDPPPAAVLDLCGLGLLSLAAFAACSLGFTPVPIPPYLERLEPQPWLAGLLYGAGGLGCGLGLRRAAQALRPERLRALPGMAWPVAAALAALALWTLLPPFLIDESLYHLTFPLQYLLHGHFVTVRGHGNSSFPAFAEMITFWPLAAGQLSAARGVELLITALGARAIVALLPEVPANTVLWGVLLMIATPVVTCLIPSSHIDVAQGVYSLVGLLCLVRYQATQSPAMLAAAAWTVGCAAACKYLALPLLPFASLAFLFTLRSWQDAGRPMPRPAAMATALGLMLVPVLPWLARNALIWGNPLFPFATDLFPASDQAIAMQQLTTLEFFMRQFGPADDGVQLFGWRALARLPWDMFFAARFGRLQFDGVIGPLAYATAVAWGLSLRAGKRPAAARLPALLGWYGLFSLAVWVSTSWQMRFIISPYWVVALAAPIFLMRLPGAQRWAVGALMAASVTWVLPATWERMPALSPAMLGDAEARHALRLERVPDSSVCDALDTLASAPGSPPLRAMLVWTQRIALWCATDLMSESYDEATSFNAWLLEPTMPATLARFRAAGITHVVIDEDSFYAMPPGGVGAEEGRELEQIFARYRQMLQEGQLRPVSRHATVALYEVLGTS